MLQFLGNAALNSLPSEEGRPFVGCWGQVGQGRGNKVETLGERSRPKSAPDFCWRGALSLFLSALPPMERMERKMFCGGWEEPNRALVCEGDMSPRDGYRGAQSWA